MSRQSKGKPQLVMFWSSSGRGQPELCYLVDGEGVNTVSLQAACEMSKGARCSIILPAVLGSCHLVKLTPKQKKGLERAYPHLLEDELLSPVEDLHHNYCEQHNSPGTDVVIRSNSVSSMLMQELQQFCQNNGLELDSVYLDAELLQRPAEGRINRIKHGDSFLYRLESGEFYVDTTEDSLLAKGAVVNPLEKEGGSGAEYLVSRICTNHDAINLLSGEFAEHQGRAWQQHIIKSAVLSGIFSALAVVAYWLAASWYFQSEEKKQLVQAEQSYRAIFPKDSRVIDVKKQALGHLKRTGETKGGADLLYLVDIIGSAFQRVGGGVVLDSLRFDDSTGQAVLGLTAKSVQQVDSLTKELAAKNLQAKLSQVNKDGGSVKARLRVTL